MTRNLFTAALAAAALALSALNAQAQDSAIGFTGAALSLGGDSGGQGASTRIDGSIDVAITRQHGLQLDLGAVDYGAVWFGNIAAHLYLQPTAGAKYGLFLAYADANDIEAATLEAGVEGMWSLGRDLTVGLRAGIGRADPSEVDYIFAGADARYALSDRLALSAGLALLDADEAAAAYTLAQADLAVSYALPRAPLEITAGLRHTAISGSRAQSDTRAFLGLTAWVGPARSAHAPVSHRRFAPVRPLRGLLARDLVWAFSAAR